MLTRFTQLYAVYLVRLGPKQVHSTIKSTTHPTSPTIVQKCIGYFFGPIKPRYTRVCLMCLTLKRFLSFLSNRRPSIAPSYTPDTNADVRGDPLQPPHPTPRDTSNTRICLHTSAETQMRHTDTNLHRDHRRLCVSCIRHRRRLDLPYDTGDSRDHREAGDVCNMLMVWRGMRCGGWGGSFRTSAFVYP